ncbi:MAG TPA: DUF6544 family protein [Verrucomicrobiae bacterium]|nr:DUF6544 family protein [Verrucomicrobiae bacterium]
MTPQNPADAAALLARLRGYLFPGGEDQAPDVQAVRIAERGEIRMSPTAKWLPFTAEQTIQATHSGSHWEARIGGGRLRSVTVVDAYERSHGLLTVKLGGIITTTRLTGPDLDRGELQRYLASFVFCPAMLLHHKLLEFTAVGPSTLRLGDRDDPGHATIDVEIAPDGQPTMCRAVRPRLVGKQAIPTPWFGMASEFREWDGMRIATRLEVAWQLPEGPFPYYRSEITSWGGQSGPRAGY